MQMIDRFDTLTERERNVLTHLQNGLTASQIAGIEYVTLATVRTHISGVLMKLGVNSQLAAVAKANRRDMYRWRCQHCKMEAAS
jgi:DNA-binding NarL/FixJ family response regulator